ncbi:MAG: hypothetical protein LBQ13_02880 [Endomicrobium sp.]|jgi:hypothetical protein|nr:hypothetical protein [Endomicrobium sp.]
MNFKEQQENLINFITNNYELHPEIITDVLDFDKYKNDFSLFVDFSRIDFRQSLYDDDCGDIEHLSIVFYLVRRNNTPAILNADILDAAYLLYELIKEKPSLGIAQNTIIESIDFYKYVEGTKYLVCSEFNLSLEIEI